MKRTPNKKLIGLFTICSLLLFSAIVLMFVGDNIFTRNNDQLVMYFEESIRGLTIGSPVSFRGVEIGKVSKIDLMTDAKNMNFSIPVFAKLNENQNFIVKNYKKIKNKDVFLEGLIQKGLRARLTTQSYLTGQLMIELEILPNAKISSKNQNTFKDTIEIPTVLSPMGELSKGLQDILVKDNIDKFNSLLETFNKNFPIILEQTALISKNINKMLSNNVGGVSMTVNNLNKAMIDISEAARSLKNLTDYLERHPEALLKGKGRY